MLSPLNVDYFCGQGLETFPPVRVTALCVFQKSSGIRWLAWSGVILRLGPRVTTEACEGAEGIALLLECLPDVHEVRVPVPALHTPRWWLRPAVSAFRRREQEDQEFKAILV